MRPKIFAASLRCVERNSIKISYITSSFSIRSSLYIEIFPLLVYQINPAYLYMLIYFNQC